MLEVSGVEKPVVDHARRLGWKVLKIKTMYDSGWPDRLFCLPLGESVYIEFKKPGGELSKRQIRVIEEMEKLGHSVYVIDEKSMGRALLEAKVGSAQLYEKMRKVSRGASWSRLVPRPRTRQD